MGLNQVVSPALLAIDAERMRVRRYVRNNWGKVWVTHEAVFEDGAPLVKELNDFRIVPRMFPMDHIPEGAA
jgi:hypothetical protein